MILQLHSALTPTTTAVSGTELTVTVCLAVAGVVMILVAVTCGCYYRRYAQRGE